jgi:hypothetical protein
MHASPEALQRVTPLIEPSACEHLVDLVEAGAGTH